MTGYRTDLYSDDFTSNPQLRSARSAGAGH